MQNSQQEQTGGAGVSYVKVRFQDIGWGPVDNREHDLGVDLFLQARDHRGFDRTALVGAQVKAGNKKYFKSPEKNATGKVVGWWYREDDAAHFDDWVQHGLPHLLILVTDRPRKAYWVHVTADKIKRTGKGCKILVPKKQRINGSNFDALMDAATSTKNTPDLQGSLYRTGPNIVGPGRALRHALIAPRLIAPRNRGDYARVLAPEEAVALITRGRIDELKQYTRNHAFLTGEDSPGKLNPDLIDASETSRDWRWRVFHAVRAFAMSGDAGPADRLAHAVLSDPEGKKQTPDLRAAATVLGAIALTDRERWAEAGSLLANIGNSFGPVDHAWLLTQRAVVLVETNDTAQARTLAAEALRSLKSDPDDVTARAISSAAASILLSTAFFALPGDAAVEESHEHSSMLDNAVSWWRSMEIATALDRHDDILFRAWATSEDPAADLSTESQNRLNGVWLSALLSGNRSAASWPLQLGARHELHHLELEWRDEVANSEASTSSLSQSAEPLVKIIDALDALRRYGRQKDLESAANRLWAAGPARAVSEALKRSVAQPWRASTARTHLGLLTAAGDLLETDSADEAVVQCLDVLTDIPAFRQRVRHAFMEWHYVPRALQTVLPAARDSVQQQVLSFVLNQMAEGAPDHRDDLAVMVTSLRSDLVAFHADQVRALAAETPDKLGVRLLQKLASAGDGQSQVELLNRADTGDLHAAVALGKPQTLTETAARTLIASDTEACRRLLDEAARNQYSPGGQPVRNLLVMSMAFPALAGWDLIFEVLDDPRVAADEKLPVLEILTAHPDVPAEALEWLRTQMADAAKPAFPSAFGMWATSDHLAAQSFALGVAVGAVDNEQALRRVMSWLRGSASSRRSAFEVVRALARRADSPAIQGVLMTLTGDPQHLIRGAAAAALVQGVEPGTSSEVEQAIAAAAQEGGCSVPLAVARSLSRTPGALEGRPALRDRLADNISARVRDTVA